MKQATTHYINLFTLLILQSNTYPQDLRLYGPAETWQALERIETHLQSDHCDANNTESTITQDIALLQAILYQQSKNPRATEDGFVPELLTEIADLLNQVTTHTKSEMQIWPGR